jgi:hypothetical protein
MFELAFVSLVVGTSIMQGRQEREIVTWELHVVKKFRHSIHYLFAFRVYSKLQVSCTIVNECLHFHSRHCLSVIPKFSDEPCLSQRLIFNPAMISHVTLCTWVAYITLCSSLSLN